MPLVADVYLPVRLSLLQSLLDTPVMLWAAAILLILALRRGTGFHPVFAVMLTASAGFAAAYVVQGKGWPYQSYPMLALALIALGLAIARRRQAMERTGEGYRFKDICAVARVLLHCGKILCLARHCRRGSRCHRDGRADRAAASLDHADLG